jgi:hypothetical protein
MKRYELIACIGIATILIGFYTTPSLVVLGFAEIGIAEHEYHYHKKEAN